MSASRIAIERKPIESAVWDTVLYPLWDTRTIKNAELKMAFGFYDTSEMKTYATLQSGELNPNGRLIGKEIRHSNFDACR